MLVSQAAFSLAIVSALDIAEAAGASLNAFFFATDAVLAAVSYTHLTLPTNREV